MRTALVHVLSEKAEKKRTTTGYDQRMQTTLAARSGWQEQPVDLLAPLLLVM